MNPELRRNLWLEMSPHRLVTAPLLELLVVMAVIAVLAGIMLPVVSRARKSAEGVGCQKDEKASV